MCEHVHVGAVTTLGRGGSDLTCTVLGAALALKEVQVWKDVDGKCMAAWTRACMHMYIYACAPLCYGRMDREPEKHLCMFRLHCRSVYGFIVLFVMRLPWNVEELVESTRSASQVWQCNHTL